jgi:hypothetical protein
MRDGADRLSELLSSCFPAAEDRRLTLALGGGVVNYQHIYTPPGVATINPTSYRLAGSLPLYFACDSTEVRFWHQRTRREILLLCWAVRETLGWSALPRFILERIGHMLQLSEFHSQFPQLDIDIFTTDTIRQQLCVFPTPEDFELADKPYCLLPHIATLETGQRGGRRVEIIRLQEVEQLDQWIEETFDFSFCRVTFDGLSLKPNDNQPMWGEANVTRYERYLSSLREHPDELLALAEEMESRLRKYDQRRFTITNAQDWRALINSMRAAAFAQVNSVRDAGAQ